jgi:hypothetical protein
MKRLITGAEGAYMFAVWLVLAVLLIVVLPLHMVTMLLCKGSESITAWATEIQSIAVAKLKG